MSTERYLNNFKGFDCLTCCANGRLINKCWFWERIFGIMRRHDEILDRYHKVRLNFWACCALVICQWWGDFLISWGDFIFRIVPCSGVTSCQKGCERSRTRTMAMLNNQTFYDFWWLRYELVGFVLTSDWSPMHSCIAPDQTCCQELLTKDQT